MRSTATCDGLWQRRLCRGVLLAAVSLAVLVLGVAAAVPGAATPTKVFMCADSGEYSGAHELGFLHAAMEERETLHLPHCQSAYLGYMTHADGHRFRALAVTTGIGFVGAAVCTQHVVALQQERGLAFEFVMLIGTSGFSPFVGGWSPANTTRAREAEADRRRRSETATLPPPARRYLSEAEWQADAAKDVLRAVERGAPAVHAVTNGLPGNVNYEHVLSQRQVAPDGCSPIRAVDSDSDSEGDDTASSSVAAAGLKANRRLSVGSICVTSAAFLQETGYCTEVLGASQCSRPHCSGFSRLINRKNIHASRSAASQRLAEDIVSASAGKAFPAAPEKVREGMKTYWRSNEAAVLAGGDADAVPTPSFVKCAESTFNAIFVGAERDFFCRENTAIVLNQQHQILTKGDVTAPEEGPYTADNVVCVQAMEAFGVLEIMSAHQEIPVAVIRTASNYDMYPQQKVYLPQTTATPAEGEGEGEGPVLPYVWRQNVNYVSPEAYDEFVVASFHYSIQTATFVVSNFVLGGRDISGLKQTH